MTIESIPLSELFTVKEFAVKHSRLLSESTLRYQMRHRDPTHEGSRMTITRRSVLALAAAPLVPALTAEQLLMLDGYEKIGPPQRGHQAWGKAIWFEFKELGWTRGIRFRYEPCSPNA